MSLSSDFPSRYIQFRESIREPSSEGWGDGNTVVLGGCSILGCASGRILIGTCRVDAGEMC